MSSTLPLLSFLLPDVHDAELYLQAGDVAESENHVISILQNKPKGDFRADLEAKPPQVSKHPLISVALLYVHVMIV